VNLKRSLARGLIAALLSTFVVVPIGPAPAGAAPGDVDGDGVADGFDIDDDNDGIVDVDETVSDFRWATFSSISGSTANGTIAATSFNYTANVTLLTTTNMYQVVRFPSQYGVPSVNPTIRNDIASTNTLTFSQPIRNPLVAFSSIGNPSTPVPVQFDRTVEVLWSESVVVNSSTRITGSEGFLILRVPGVHSSISFNYLANETYVNFAFGADLRAAVDSDNDGIDDSYDLDSDNDGIPDNVEAQTTAAYVSPSGIDFDGNGLDDAYETTPGSGEGLQPVDTDGSNGPDVLDLDSDGDGISDLAESGLGLTDLNSDGRTDGVVGVNGLDDDAESADTYADPNGGAHNGAAFLLVDTDDDTAADGSDAAPRGQDLDWRDNRFDCDAANPSLDCDLDGNPNGTDPHPSAATAVDDSMSARVGTTMTSDIVANDDFVAGSNTSMARIGGTAAGIVTFDADAGTMSYRPAASEGGATVTVDYEVCNTASAPVCATATVTISVAAASADLAVVAVDPGPITPGGSGDATVTVQNLGPSDTTAVAVVYTPPTGATVDMAALPAGCVADTPTAGSITCDLGALTSGSSGQVLVPVLVGSGASAGLLTAGGVVSASSNSADPVSANSTTRPAPVTVGSSSADLAITVDSVPTLAPGGAGVIDLNVLNLGPSTGGGFRVRYELPLGVAFDAGGPNPSGCTRSAIVVTCEVAGPMAVGANLDVRIPVRMLRALPTAGPIAGATAALTNRSVTDPAPGNDTVLATPVLDLSGDSDGDGISDADEIDPDGTGRPADADGDGIPDYLDIPGVDIAGEVYRDLNRNGALDPGEPSLSGVLVSLLAPGADGTLGTADDVIVATTRTASPYRFTNVANGSYDVVVDRGSLINGMLATNDVDGGANSIIRIVVAGASVSGQDFGANHIVVTGVFTDDDGRPIGNATITFIDAAGNVIRTTTDADGGYRIEGTDERPIATGAATVRGRTAAGVEVIRTVNINGHVTVANLSELAPQGRPDELAFTGGEAGHSSRHGLLAIAVGAGLLLVRRRSRTGNRSRR